MDVHFFLTLGVIFGTFALISAILAAAHKRHFLVHVAIALYITMAVITIMPQKWLGGALSTLSAVCVIFVCVLLVGSSMFWAVDEWQDYRVPWRFMIFGIATFGMMMSIMVPFVQAAGISIPFMDADTLLVFTKQPARFLWVIAPLVMAAVLRRV